MAVCLTVPIQPACQHMGQCSKCINGSVPNCSNSASVSAYWAVCKCIWGSVQNSYGAVCLTVPIQPACQHMGQCSKCINGSVPNCSDSASVSAYGAVYLTVQRDVRTVLI